MEHIGLAFAPCFRNSERLPVCLPAAPPLQSWQDQRASHSDGEVHELSLIGPQADVSLWLSLTDTLGPLQLLGGVLQ